MESHYIKAIFTVIDWAMTPPCSDCPLRGEPLTPLRKHLCASRGGDDLCIDKLFDIVS